MAAIVPAEILMRYSTKLGAAGNTTASSANASLGTYISTTAWSGGAVNDLFDDVTGAENAASTVDYRCIFVYNSNTLNALQNAVVYLSAEVAGGTTISIAPDTTAATALGSAPIQAGNVATEITAPTTVGAFSAPTTVGTGLALGSIPVGFVKAFWIKRTAANTAALSGDGVTIAVTGDTGSL